MKYINFCFKNLVTNLWKLFNNLKSITYQVLNAAFYLFFEFLFNNKCLLSLIK